MAARDIMEDVPLFIDSTAYLTYAEIARAIVDEGWAQTMTRQGVIRLAKHDPAWPVPEGDCERPGAGSRAAWFVPWDDRLKLYFRDRAAGAGQLKVRGHRPERLAAYLKLLQAGVDQDEAARQIGISLETARVYRRILRDKGLLPGPKSIGDVTTDTR